VSVLIADNGVFRRAERIADGLAGISLFKESSDDPFLVFGWEAFPKPRLSFRIHVAFLLSGFFYATQQYNSGGTMPQKI
jgi:hypothetical protein